MARPLTDIYDSIIAEKNTFSNLQALQPNIDSAQTLLSDLNTPSRVAHWRLWVYLVAFCVWLHETLWDLFKKDVDETIAKFRPGTLRWYQEQAFAFQYGHVLAWDATDKRYKYATDDAAVRIVKLCSVTEPAGVVTVKAAKLFGTNVLPLTNLEVQSLQAYFAQIKYPGALTCVSFSADRLKVYGTIKYTAMVDLLTLRSNVEAAINAYIKGLEFDGRFNINKLIDVLQTVTGVVDFTDVTVETTYGGLPYTVVDDEYQTNAGYAEVDAAFPLANTITYVPYV